jgi:hypothetical protein
MGFTKLRQVAPGCAGWQPLVCHSGIARKEKSMQSLNAFIHSIDIDVGKSRSRSTRALSLIALWAGARSFCKE